MKDLNPDSISESFKKLAADGRKRLEPLRETLTSLGQLVGDIQQAGISVSFEVMNLDAAKKHNFTGRMDDPDMAYCLLGIYDALFIMRVKPGHICTLRRSNINEPRPLQKLAEENFWSSVLVYDLSRENGRNSFVDTITSYAARRAPYHDLGECNVNPVDDIDPRKKMIRKSL